MWFSAHDRATLGRRGRKNAHETVARARSAENMPKKVEGLKPAVNLCATLLCRAAAGGSSTHCNDSCAKRFELQMRELREEASRSSLSGVTSQKNGWLNVEVAFSHSVSQGCNDAFNHSVILSFSQSFILQFVQLLFTFSVNHDSVIH